MTDDVPEFLKQERLERLNELQRLITAERFEQRVGRTVRAIVDRVDEESIEARAIWQAHEIDGTTQVLGAGDSGLGPGAIVDVRVESVVDDYDLTASLEAAVDLAPSPQHRAPSRRALPLATIGSYGR